MNKPLDEGAFASDVLQNLPEPDINQVQGAINPLGELAPQPPANLFDATATGRHGRIAGRSLGIGYQRTTGKELDKEVGDTIGEMMGEVFGVLNGMGSKVLYWIMLLLCMAPVVMVVLRDISQVTKERGQ